MWVDFGATVFASGDHAEYQAICSAMMRRFRRLLEGDEVP